MCVAVWVLFSPLMHSLRLALLMGGQTADQLQHKTPFILSFRSATRDTAQPIQVGTDDASCPKPE
jgi:hypothetical protein